MKEPKKVFIKQCLKSLKKEPASEISLRSISKAIGVSPMMVYRHFKSKRHLFSAIAEEGFTLLESEIREAQKLYPQDPSQQLEEAGLRYIGMALKNPEHIKVMFGGILEDHSDLPELDEKGKYAFGALVEIVVSGQKAQQFPAGDPLAIALSAWSMVHGFSMLLVQGQLQFLNVNLENYREQAQKMVKMMAVGLKSSPSDLFVKRN